MGSIFLELLNRSINAGWLVLAVIPLRHLLKKAPKTLFIILWALVGIRLICPFSPESVFSLIPTAEPIPTTILYSEPATPSGAVDIANETDANIAFSADARPAYTAEAAAVDNIEANDPVKLLNFLSTAVWAVGMLGLLLYAAVSSLRLRHRIRESIPLRENIRLCDRVDTPFLLGFFRPRIYLPSSLTAEDAEYAIAHERAHIKRHDHWWKPLGFVVLTVYWFNPLLWIAYILLCRDIELACDEKVIRQLGADSKKPYSMALINCSVPRRMIAFCPLAFGEVAVKERVKTVLHYKKPSFWLSSVAVVACIASALCFLTDPIGTAEVLTPEPSVQPSVEAQAPAREDTAEEALKAKPAQTDEQEYTPEEIALMRAVLGNRGQSWYSSVNLDEYGNEYETYNFELSEEIAEKYGTRDSRLLPHIMVFQNFGDLDYSETFEMCYGIVEPYSGKIPVVEQIETYTVEIPAHGIAFVVLENKGDYPNSFSRLVSATYGDLSFEL